MATNGETWAKTKVENLAEYITVGFVGSMSSLFVDEGVPLLRGQNINPYALDLTNLKYISQETHRKWKKSALKPGDVVIVRVGYPGTACVIPEGIGDLNAASLVIVRPNPTILDSKFLSYVINSPWGKAQVAGRLVGSAQQVFNTQTAAELEIPAPPLPVQRRIAGILSAYDELIENSQRRIRILEEMARALYREWFVHFRFPGHEKAKLVDSPLGPIPQGWEVKKLSEVCRLTMGQSPKSEFYNEAGDGLPFHQGVTDFGDRFPTDRLFCTTDGRIAEAGDILFSVRAPVGRMNIARRKIIIGRGLSSIRHTNGHQAFLWEQLRNRFTKDDMMGNGAIFAAVTKDDMQGIELLCPPQSLVLGSDKHFVPIHGEIGKLTFQIQNLRQTRNLLLPRLLSGQVDLKEN